MTNGRTQEPLVADPLSIERDSPWNRIARRRYEHDAPGSLTAAIADVQAGSAYAADAPPLYDAVDSGALEDAFFPADERGDDQQSMGAAVFRYSALLVEVRSDGWIHVYETTDTNCTDD